MNMFSQNEILLMILIVSVLLIFIIVLTILDIIEYKKNKNKDLLDNLDLPNLEESTLDDESPLIKPLEEEVEVLELPDNTKEEILTIDNREDSIEQRIEKEKVIPSSNIYENIKEEVNIEDFIPQKLSINEELKKIEETMVDTQEDLENTITSFEEEQERTAIISIDELLKHSDNLYTKNEQIQYDDSNAPISVDEIMNNYNSVFSEPVKNIEEPTVLKETLKEERPIYTHKEEMPFISSIYGVESDEMSFENTANFEKMDRAKTNEFMRRLKEMSENK